MTTNTSERVFSSVRLDKAALLEPLPLLRSDPRGWFSGLLRRPWMVAWRPLTMRPYLLGEFVVVLVLLKFYDGVRGRADVRRSAAMANGDEIMRIEHHLHIQIEPAINRWVTEHHALSLAASYWYQFAHLSVTLTVLAICWWKSPQIYRSARNALVIINGVALMTFFLLPTAPPRLLPHYSFVDSVALAGFGTTHGGPVTADQYGAFPSLHIGWAVWTAVVAFQMVRSARLARSWLAYPLVTCFVIVATGNHYLLDAVAGGGLALFALGLAHLVRRRAAAPAAAVPAAGAEAAEGGRAVPVPKKQDAPHLRRPALQLSERHGVEWYGADRRPAQRSLKMSSGHERLNERLVGEGDW